MYVVCDRPCVYVVALNMLDGTYPPGLSALAKVEGEVAASLSPNVPASVPVPTPPPPALRVLYGDSLSNSSKSYSSSYIVCFAVRGGMNLSDQAVPCVRAGTVESILLVLINQLTLLPENHLYVGFTLMKMQYKYSSHTETEYSYSLCKMNPRKTTFYSFLTKENTRNFLGGRFRKF